MKVRVRTLSNEEVEIEAQPEKGENVFSLKEKIEQQWAHMPAIRQRLVHAGKVLGDAQLLSEIAIKEGDRIVVMLTKAAAAAAAGSSAGGTSTTSSSSSSSTAAAAAGAQSATAASDASSSTGAKEAASASGSSRSAAAASSAATAKNDPSSGSAAGEGTAAAPAALPEGPAASGGTAGDATDRDAATASDSSSSHTAAESVLQTGVQLEETLEQLVMMGFPRQSAEQAMRAAFNNPDRAVEYLMNGLPENVSALLGGGVGLPGGGGDADAAAAAVAAAAEELQQEDIEEETSAAAAAEDEAAAAADTSNPLAALRRHPAFNQIRQMVQANPAMLPQVLQLIGSSNPQLLELITQNQDAFLEVLQQEEAEEAGAAAGQQHGHVDPASGVIQITRDEMEALQRLEALGFTRHQAVEAYLACDRNEEMAANFLLENINDLDGDGAAGGSGAAE